MYFVVEATRRIDMTVLITGVHGGVGTVFLYPVRGGSVAAFLDAARKADVQHVVLLSSPAAYEVHEHDRLIGLVHRAVEQTVRDSGLNHTVLYPSWLASNAQRDWG